jgi:hypothetical protein
MWIAGGCSKWLDRRSGQYWHNNVSNFIQGDLDPLLMSPLAQDDAASAALFQQDLKLLGFDNLKPKKNEEDFFKMSKAASSTLYRLKMDQKQAEKEVKDAKERKEANERKEEEEEKEEEEKEENVKTSGV